MKRVIKPLLLGSIVFIILFAIAALSGCEPIESTIEIHDTIYVYVTDTVKIVKTDSVINDELVTDASGNIYTTVQIGQQIWINSNLRTLKYNDGTDIPTTSINLRTLINPAYQFSHNQTTDIKQDGYYYTWYCINKICPVNYHIPTIDDWNELQQYVDGKSLASNKGWNEYIYEPSVGYKQENNNTLGFNSFPSGLISSQAYGLSYDNYGSMAAYWTSTEYNDEYKTRAYIKYITYNSNQIQVSDYPKNWAFNVRCIKNK